MTVPSTSVRARPGQQRLVVVAGLLALVLVVALSALLARGPDVLRGAPPGHAYDETSAVVTKGARSEALAFLTVDYRRMDAVTADVLAGATGAFKSQYDDGRADLTRDARARKAVGSGRIASVGVSELTAKDAIVLVAATATVRQTPAGASGPQASTRVVRLRLHLELRHGRWLTSSLAYVPERP